MQRILFAMLLAVANVGSTADVPIWPGSAPNLTSGKHFDRVLIIVLENQSYVAAKKDNYLRELAGVGRIY